MFTIEQLDTFNTTLRGMGQSIMDEESTFVSAYFSKIFSNELSAET